MEDQLEEEEQPRGRGRSLSFIDEEEERIQRGIVENNGTSNANATDSEGITGQDSAGPNTTGGSNSANVRPGLQPRRNVPLSKKTLNIVTNLKDQVESIGIPVNNVLSQEEFEEEALEAEAVAKAATAANPKASDSGKEKKFNYKSGKATRRTSATKISDNLMKNEGHDYYVKVLLLGDSGVGKTSLMLRFADNQFQESLMSTAGVDFKVRFLEKDNKRVKCQIWDTAGQERFHVITRAYYRGSHGIALVYDATRESSFKQIEYWMENIKKHASSDVFVVLLGNKTDLPDKKITFEQGKEMAERYKIKFFETSAKTGANVVEAFEMLSDQIVTKWENEPKETPVAVENNNTVNLLSENHQKKKLCSIL